MITISDLLKKPRWLCLVYAKGTHCPCYYYRGNFYTDEGKLLPDNPLKIFYA